MQSEIDGRCITVECATPHCSREHLIILGEEGAMSAKLLIHCMACLWTMIIVIDGIDEESGTVAMKRGTAHTQKELRELIEKESAKQCLN